MTITADSVTQKIWKILQIFFFTLLISLISNLLVAVILNNPVNSGGDIVVILPIGWAINTLLLVAFLIISVRKINDNFIGKIILPLLMAFVLAFILFGLPVYTFQLGMEIRDYFLVPR